MGRTTRDSNAGPTRRRRQAVPNIEHRRSSHPKRHPCRRIWSQVCNSHGSSLFAMGVDGGFLGSTSADRNCRFGREETWGCHGDAVAVEATLGRRKWPLFTPEMLN
ncbi:hypothetical protein HAX54_006282 [Datura stramonium]|uniref:Uncharacterized protein n=1 Tax=Datura stramonium TaxID=4076 RepID=A0ABS8TA15_DATST|nr:hypothetical protein [Datura stramonium]